MNEPIYVTRTILPDKERFKGYVDAIYAARQLTNNGPLVQKLEEELSAFLKCKHLAVCANGTLALMLALRCASLSGKKVLVTPFSYVATLTSLLWEQCTPIFVDIDPDSLCLSPVCAQKALEEHPDCAGILAVHVYGIACDVEAFDRLAKEYHVQVLYDAAHTFGETLNGKSLLGFGDISICSFHATKAFHTVEGGCVCVNSQAQLDSVKLMRAFGHIGDRYYDVGINAKLSEFHAAMGLSLLPDFEAHVQKRKKISLFYDATLTNPAFMRPSFALQQTKNYAYYPLIFPSETVLLAAMQRLAAQKIYPRRYFYPSCNTLPYLSKELKRSCPVAEDISRRILCLPIYSDLSLDTAQEIVDTLQSL